MAQDLQVGVVLWSITIGLIVLLLAVDIMRAIFIALGGALLSLFSFVFLLFGLLLIYTAVQLFRHRDEDPDIESNVAIKAARRLPITASYVEGRALHSSGRSADGYAAVPSAGSDRKCRPVVRA